MPGRDTHLRAFAARSGEMGHPNEILTAEEYGSSSRADPADVVVLHGRTGWGKAERFTGPWRTVAWVHDQSFVCPATISWFRNSRAACALPVGPWCVYNGYLEHCNARHPVANLRNVHAVARTRRNIPHLDRIIVASEYMRARLTSGGVDPRVIRVLPYFVRIPELAPASEVEQPFRILYLGRVNEMKGLDVLVAAMALLPRNCELQIAGEGAALVEVREKARQLGLAESQLSFSGFLPDPAAVAALYASAALVVVPSLWPEPFGIVGLEALARGKALVVSRVGGIPEWMEDGAYGFLATPDDPQDFADKILRLIENPALRHACGARGREFVAREFTWEKHWAGFLGAVS